MAQNESEVGGGEQQWSPFTTWRVQEDDSDTEPEQSPVRNGENVVVEGVKDVRRRRILAARRVRGAMREGDGGGREGMKRRRLEDEYEKSTYNWNWNKNMLVVNTVGKDGVVTVGYFLVDPAAGTRSKRDGRTRKMLFVCNGKWMYTKEQIVEDLLSRGMKVGEDVLGLLDGELVKSNHGEERITFEVDLDLLRESYVVSSTYDWQSTGRVTALTAGVIVASKFA